jgi:nitroimidazol reductase NimA-like FMN-containing flavoprotein (pyridoxamine 5'-phosphate oxidase superfamily)
MEQNMRRKDREISDRDELLEVISQCDVCRIALNDEDGTPYILPLNFGHRDHDGKLTLYFHSALEGKKLKLIERDARAAFEMDTRHELEYIADKGYCTFAYECVMGKGTIRILPDDEKAAALDILMDHYHPGQHAYYNPASMPRTVVYCLEVEEMTGKRKKPHHT